MAEARLRAALEGSHAVLRGPRRCRVRPMCAGGCGRCAAAVRRLVVVRRHAGGRRRSGRRHRLRDRGARAELRRAAGGLGEPGRHRRRRRRRGQVPAPDLEDRRRHRGRAPRPRARPAPRCPRPPTSTAAPATPRRPAWPSSPSTSSRAFAWDDLVLPDRQLDVLRSISAFLRHRDLVLSEWGYDRTVARTQGLKVLFAGESGTGKTMAAQVLAARPRARPLPDRPRLDRRRSTSARPRRTSTASSPRPRAPTRSSSSTRPTRSSASAPRCATRTTATPTSRSPTCCSGWTPTPAPSILATNFRQNMDDAFLRRLDFVVDFPFPEAADRERIWRLVLPSQAPVADDVDTGFLANQFKLAGGNIRNASLAAAFAAAEERQPDRDAPPDPRGRARVRQARPADARVRLRALPRRHPRQLKGG